MGVGTLVVDAERIDAAKMNLKLEIVDHANKKLRAIVALADEDKTLTGVQLADSSTFTITPTVARTLTTDTAANIIAAVPGAAAGMWYDVTIVNRAAFNITLAAGTDVTLVGATVIVKEGGSWRAHITSGTTVTFHNTANVELLGLTTNKIADLNVTTAKINDLAVTTAKIDALQVTTAKIADSAVQHAQKKLRAIVALADEDKTLTGVQMADSSTFTITPTVARTLTTDTAANIIAAIPRAAAGMWYDFTVVNLAAFNITLAAGTDVTLSGATVAVKESATFKVHVTSGTTVTIHNNTTVGLLGVTTAKIADLNVTTVKLADLAVTTAKIEALHVTTAKIADLAVTTAKIEDLHVTTGKIAAAAVTLAKTTFLTKVFAFNFASIADGAFEQTGALAFAGATFGSSLCVGCSIDTVGLLIHARVTAADEIRIWAQNETGAAVDLAAADFTVLVLK